jgi:hypothetical protein
MPARWNSSTAGWRHPFHYCSPGDRLILTADHGNDPSWKGTDHSREQIPVLCTGPGLASGSIGKRDSFADIGQSIANYLGIAPLAAGKSASSLKPWLSEVRDGTHAKAGPFAEESSNPPNSVEKAVQDFYKDQAG